MKTCFSNEGQPADPACPAGFSRTYIGTNCAGTEAWEAEHGNKACDCTDGVCKNCCKEECFDDNTHTCSWRDANLGRIYVVDDACPDGYSRFYQGSNCAGTQPWACDCEDGVCAKCCREVVQP